MEIILKRIAKQKTYTIGRLYIVNAGVEREILPGKRLDDKRIIRAKVDESQLTQEPEEVDARHSRISGKVARKVKARQPFPKVPIVCSSPSRLALRHGCLCCRECPTSKASAFMPATIPTIRRAASSWAKTGM